MSSTADGAAASASNAGPVVGWPWRINIALTALPDRLLLIVLWTTVGVSVALVLGLFYPLVVVPGAIVLTVLFWRVRPTPLRTERRSAAGAVVALGIVAAWIQFNRHYRGELLSIARDPGVYTARAWWLMNHASPNIPVGSTYQAINGIRGANVAAGGFPFSHGEIQPQGNSTVPGLLAIAGWVGKAPALLQANVVLGGLALLAVYAFARRLLGPVWGLVPMIGLALSMPMVYFSRNTYSEPVALLVTFLGLTLLWSAWRAQSNGQFAVAGLAFGAAQLARIDGAIAVLGACVGIGLVAVLAADPATRRRSRGHLMSFAAAAGFIIAIGTLDLLRNSEPYLHAQRKSIEELVAAVVLAVVILLALSWLSVVDFLRRYGAEHRYSLARFAGIVAVLGFLVMLSRPFWFVGHFVKDAPIQRALQVYQTREHLPVDGTRSYDEQTLHWMSWYIGWPTVILAAAGMAWLLWRTVQLRRPAQLTFLSTFGVVSLLYLNDINITPIQIWAMRRLLPVVLPGALVLATWAAVRIGRRWLGLRWLSVGLLVAVAALPALSWNSLVTVGEETGEYAEVNAMCGSVHGDKALFVGDIPLSGSYLPTLRVVCNKDSVYVSTATPAILAELSQRWGGGPITVFSFNAREVPWTRSPTALYTGRYPYWPSPISTRPAGPVYDRRTLWVGDLQPDGRVAPRSG